MRSAFWTTLALVTSLTSSADDLHDACLERRGSLEVSSEGVRIRVADVNKCESRESRAILNLEEVLPFKKLVIANGGKSLPYEVIADGVTILKKFADAARALEPKPVAIKGIATGVFRQVDNAQVFFKIARDLGISVKILTPEEEAVLSYHSVLTVLPAGSQHFVVWGIGGSSEQFAAKKDGAKKDEFETFSDPVGAVSFRAVVSQFKGLGSTASPNPLTAAEVQKAHAAVPQTSTLAGNARLKQLIASRGGQVVGVGGVLAESLPNQLQKTEYTAVDLDESIKVRAGLFDGQIGGQYADTQTTNLILVRAMMRALGIEKVRALAVRPHAGLLTSNEWWARVR